MCVHTHTHPHGIFASHLCMKVFWWHAITSSILVVKDGLTNISSGHHNTHCHYNKARKKKKSQRKWARGPMFRKLVRREGETRKENAKPRHPSPALVTFSGSVSKGRVMGRMKWQNTKDHHPTPHTSKGALERKKGPYGEHPLIAWCEDVRSRGRRPRGREGRKAQEPKFALPLGLPAVGCLEKSRGQLEALALEKI